MFAALLQAQCMINKVDWDMNGPILQIKANLLFFSLFLNRIHLFITMRMDKDTRMVIAEVAHYLPKPQAFTLMMDPTPKAMVAKEHN